MIEYKSVKKEIGDKCIIRDLSMTIHDGEFIVMIGPSGCGKTTTVKMINRLLEPTEGEILIDGVNTRDMDLVKLRTSIGYVIQQIGLFPNMTVEENIAVVPNIMKWDKEAIHQRVQELMEMVDMPYEQFGKKYPRQLSGGQQQRIGVLRALAARPPILLMDEPFGALDPITRETLQREIKKIQQKLHITVLFITHDMHEAVKLADRIVFMDQGQILQMGTPKELICHPANEKVAQFISLQNVGLDEQQLTAEDIMTPSERVQVPQEDLVVSADCLLSQLADTVDLSDNRRIYVRNEQGRIVGELTAASILRRLVKKAPL